MVSVGISSLASSFSNAVLSNGDLIVVALFDCVLEWGN